MENEGFYPRCGICGKGRLLPVNLGSEEGHIKYRCTDPRCNARFDEHGYEVYSEERQDWIRDVELGD